MDASSARPRAIFFGTPEFAVPCLGALQRVAEVVLVVTQPDRPSGRGLKLQPPPVKRLAEAHGLSVVQPTKVRTAEFARRLSEADADVGVVVAYGRILPSRVLETPRHGCVNVHASLLPALRGAAPINWAIARGERETGVCLMQMDAGMDTGPVLACRKTPIGPDETAGELSERLSALGASLLEEALPRHLRGELTPHPQPESGVSYAPMLRKQDGEVPWHAPVQAVYDHVRGMTPWPGAYTWVDGKRLKLHRVRARADASQDAPPGTVVRADAHGVEVACAGGLLILESMQPEGKRPMTAAQFLAGHRLGEGTVLGARTGGEAG